MKVLQYGLVLIIGIAAQACGDDSGDSGGGADDGDTGGKSGSTGSGGSSSGTTGSGGSSGKGGSTSSGGSSSGTTGNGGSSSGTTGNGGSSSGTTGNGGSSSGTTGVGGTAGTGGCPAGTENRYDDWYAIPECADYFDCIVDVACGGNPVPDCVEIVKTGLQSSVCTAPGTDLSMAGTACATAAMAVCP